MTTDEADTKKGPRSYIWEKDKEEGSGEHFDGS